jgi:hypothetical protein
MKKTKIFYRVFTGLFAFVMAGSAIPDVMLHPAAVKGMHEGLGYPLYFVPFIGVAKLLGVIAILVPGFHRLKEWAYAGLLFDLIGATYSLASVGGLLGDYLFMLMPLTLWALSYIFYHKAKQSNKTAPDLLNSRPAPKAVLQ